MKVFISYCRSDEPHARRLYQSLQGAGVSVWFDQESLKPGQLWEDVIHEEIRAADIVILLLSSHAIDRRGYFQVELKLALQVSRTIPPGHIYLVPVRVDDCDVPHPVAAFQYVDLFPNWKSGLERLLGALNFQHDVWQEALARKEKVTNTISLPSLPLASDNVGGAGAYTGARAGRASSVPQPIEVTSRPTSRFRVSGLTGGKSIAVKSHSRRVLSTTAKLVRVARGLENNYAGSGSPIRDDQVSQLLVGAKCHLEVFPFRSDVVAMALPRCADVYPILVNRRAHRIDRQFAILHEIAHVLAGDAEEAPVFLTDCHDMANPERVADLFALADLVPAWWVEECRRMQTPWREVRGEIMLAITEYATSWTEERIEDRAGLRLELYLRWGI